MEHQASTVLAVMMRRPQNESRREGCAMDGGRSVAALTRSGAFLLRTGRS